jgi:diguanylate cyclase (GGDEF)-like protein
VRGELWGHLGAVSWEVGAFEERHEPTLEGLAGILGLAIEAAQAPSVDEVDPDRAVREAVAAAAGLGRISALLASGIWNSVPETAFDRYTRLVGRVVDAPVALLSLVGGDSQVFKSRVSPDPLPESTPLSHSFCKHVAADDAPLVVTDARLDPILESNRAVEDLSVISYLGVPVHDPAGRAIGALCAIDSVPRAWSDEDVEALTDLSAAVSTEIALRSTMASSEQRARTDELTGVWNRRQLEDAVEFRAVASAAPLGGHLLLFDVDDFKRVNDTHGHRAGDCVLREVARRTSSVLRASDTIARWGGDEFVVVLDHDPGKAEALEVAERVLAAVSGAPFALPDGADLEVSVSIGVSRWGPEDELAEVFERSDRALIEAKRGGRNRVVAVD